MSMATIFQPQERKFFLFFKQAIRRKLVELKLSVEFRNEEMKHGSIDFLTVTPKSEMR